MHDFLFLRRQKGVDLSYELIRRLLHLVGVALSVILADGAVLLKLLEQVKTVAAQKSGVDALMEALDKHWAHMKANGDLRRRRERRAADEIETIALASLRTRFGNVRGHHGLSTLAARVVDGDTDPYSAADALLTQVDI